MVVDAGGTVVNELRYSAFGETRYQYIAPNETLRTDYLYTSQRQEAEIGLYYYVARWYDPAIGRFIQADSEVPYPENVLGYDRFAYAANNPIRYIDPTGHWWCEGLPDCDKWVEALLDVLENKSGSVGKEVYDKFIVRDSKNEVRFVFSDDVDGGMQVWPRTVSLKPLDFKDDIRINNSLVSVGKLPPDRYAGLLGHEFTHLGQPFFTATSIVGELAAYEIQWQILDALGANTGHLDELHNFVSTHDIYKLEGLENDKARNLIESLCKNCRYDLIPTIPGDFKFIPSGGGGGGNPKNIVHLFE